MAERQVRKAPVSFREERGTRVEKNSSNAITKKRHGEAFIVLMRAGDSSLPFVGQ